MISKACTIFALKFHFIFVSEIFAI